MTKERYSPDEGVMAKKKKDLEEFHKSVRKKEVDDFKKVLSLPEGRRVMWKILSDSGVFRSSFTGNSTTFFNEGKRDIGLLVLGGVNAAGLGFLAQMQEEFANEQKQKAHKLEDLNGKRND